MARRMKRNAGEIRQSLQALAELYPDGELHLAVDPAGYLEKVAAEVQDCRRTCSALPPPPPVKAKPVRYQRQPRGQVTPEQARAFVERYGNLLRASNATGIPRTTLREAAKRNPGARRLPLTHGVVPAFGTFARQATTWSDDGSGPVDPGAQPVYWMQLKPRAEVRAADAAAAGLPVGGGGLYEFQDLESLHEFVSRLTSADDDESQMLAGSILWTLGFEWI